MGGPPEGLRAQARKKLGDAVSALIEALAILKEDVRSEEGKRIVDALKVLGPVAPEAGPEGKLAALTGGGPKPPMARPPGMLGTPTPSPMNVLGGAPLGAPPGA